MANQLGSDLYENFLHTLSHKPPSKVPVALWYTRSVFGLLGGARNLQDYYTNSEIKLTTQLYPLDRFPEALIFPGIYPDYGVALEASAFGCPIKFFDNSPPQPFPLLKDIKDVGKLKKVNPSQDGLMPQALKEFAYMLAHIGKQYVKRLPYLDGCGFVMGPLEVAAFILGRERLFTSFYDQPDLVHKLLTIITDGIITWLKTVEKVSGELKLISLIEHTPGQISSVHCEEFFFPYCSEILRNFPKAIKLYHNEDNISHIMKDLPKIGAQIWHFGPWEIRGIKEAVGQDLVLMGNLHPVSLLLEGTPEAVEENCRLCISIAAPGSGYILSSGGGLAPGTPISNIEAMIRSPTLYTAPNAS